MTTPPSTTVVVPSTLPSTGSNIGTPLTPHTVCEVNGNPNVSTSTWTDLIHSQDSSATNPSGAVPQVLGITEDDILRIVFEVDVPGWGASVDPAFFLAYLYPEDSQPGPTDSIYYAGAYPPPGASGAVPVGPEPGYTSGARALPLPPLPGGHGLFKLQFYALGAGWDFAVQRCDDSGSESF